MAKAENTMTTVSALIQGDDIASTIDWMKKMGIIMANSNCVICNSKMINVLNPELINMFSCENANCEKYKMLTDARDKSFFGNSQIDLKKWLHLMDLWCNEVSEEGAQSRTKLLDLRVENAYRDFREVCVQYFRFYPVKLGGNCSRVLIYYPPRIKENQIRILTMLDVTINPNVGYMEALEDDDEQKIDAIIEKVIVRDSIEIYVKKHASREFKLIESYWNKHEYIKRKINECAVKDLDSYLKQIMWFEKFGDEPFVNLCKHINCTNNIFKILRVDV